MAIHDFFECMFKCQCIIFSFLSYLKFFLLIIKHLEVFWQEVEVVSFDSLFSL